MNLTELDTALRKLRLSGMAATLDSITSRLGSVGRRRYEALIRESDGYRFLTASESDTTRGASIGDLSPVPWLVLPYRLALTGALATADPRRLDIAGGHPMAVRSTSVRVGDQTTTIFPDSSEQLPGSSSWTVVRMDTVAVREVLLSPPSGPVKPRACCSAPSEPAWRPWCHWSFHSGSAGSAPTSRSH